ncbi:MAG: tetratricopeptide repeat protein [Bdellovibrionota bacterium]
MAVAQKKIRLGDLLVRASVIDEMQLSSALAQQKQWGGRLGRHLVQLGFTDDKTISRALSKQLGLPAMDMTKEPIDLKLLKKFPEKFSTEHGCLPFRQTDKTVCVVMADPTNLVACDEIQARLGKRIEIYVAAEHSIGELINRAYRALDYGQDLLEPAPEGGVSISKAQVAAEVSKPPEEAPPSYGPLPPEAKLPKPPPAPGDSFQDLQDRLEAFAAGDPKAAASAPAPPPPSPPPASAVPAGGRAVKAAGLRQILLFDSNAKERRDVRLALRREGYDVREAHALAQVPQQIQQVIPDAMILEVEIEDMGAIELSKKLKGSSRFGSVPIILATGYFRGWRSWEDLAELSNADAVLEKPLSIHELLLALEAVLGPRPGSSDADDAARAQARRLLAEGRALFDVGDYQLAVDCFEQAVEFDETLAEIYLSLATVYERLGKPYKAIAAYEKAAELEPGNFLIFKNLSLVYEKLGFRRKAYEIFERSARSCPNPQVKEKIIAYMAKLL